MNLYILHTLIFGRFLQRTSLQIYNVSSKYDILLLNSKV